MFCLVIFFLILFSCLAFFPAGLFVVALPLPASVIWAWWTTSSCSALLWSNHDVGFETGAVKMSVHACESCQILV